MATSEGIPSSIDIEFLELNDNPYLVERVGLYTKKKGLASLLVPKNAYNITL